MNEARCCGTCGQPARITVLVGYSGASQRLLNYCGACADGADLHGAPVAAAPALAPLVRTLAVVAGLSLCALSLLADHASASVHQGFGGFQLLGTAIGLMLTVLALVVRSGAVVLLGTSLFAIALSADWLFLETKHGLGWKQRSALALSVGLLLLAAAPGLWRPHRRRE